jgi:hypothetical protein
MRRLDWILAGVIAAFLIGALATQATSGLISRLGGGAHVQGFSPDEVSFRRLVTRLPAQILPTDER